MFSTLTRFAAPRMLAACSMAATLALAAGCSEGPVDDTAGAIHFSPLETDEVAAEAIAAPEMVPEGEREQIRTVVDGFSRNAAAFFESGDPEGRLPQIESIFITSGRYLDLVGIYQNVVDAQGISSRATPRLARAYLRLGQDHKARELLDRMKAERADDPITWFLGGAYWLPQAESSQEAAAHVIAHWEEALDVDPDFNGFEQPDAPSLREQLDALRERTPEDEVQRAVEELDQLADDEPAVATAEPQPETELQPEAEPQPEAASKPAPAADPALIAEAQPRPEPDTEPEPVAVTVARGQMALSQGDRAEAERFFNQALERDPQNVDARLGLAENAWHDEARRDDLAASVRKLAERDDLTARQQYEIGLFAYSKMKDHQLATSLWTEAKERDPDLADSVGLDGLLERATR